MSPRLADNPFLRMAATQLADDIRRGPDTLRERLRPAGRAQRCGNIAELRAAARRTLPRTVFEFVDGGAGDEVTTGRNEADFRRLVLRPRFLRDVSTVRLDTTVLGERIELPIVSSPMGGGGLVHPSGEAGVAQAMHDSGSLYVLSAMGSQTIEHVADRAPGPK
jgi:L-lactate dehydrogenase (cytochrome)